MRKWSFIADDSTIVKKSSEQEVITMTREQAKQNLKSIGIEEPTDEQVSAYLNQFGAENKKEKEKAEQYKSAAEKSAELQAELDRLNEEKMSDVEKANKATETANTRVAELEKQIKAMEIKNKLAEKGITGDDATGLIDSDGNIDFDVLGKIIADRENAAATAKEKEIAANASNPGSGKAGTDDSKTSAEQLVEKMFQGKENKQDILANYV